MSSPLFAPPLAGSIVGSESSDFVIAEWKDDGGPPSPPRWIAPLHRHRKDDEAWYVLEAKAGSAVFVQRGTPHTYWNPGPGLVRYLLVMTSNIYSLIQGIHAMKERPPGALAEIFKKHDSELLG